MPPARATKVKKASHSPPPLPPGPIPTASNAGPVDQPINSLGDGPDEDDEDHETEDEDGEDRDENDEDGDEDEGSVDDSTSSAKRKGKEKASDVSASGEAGAEGDAAHPWQAVWSADKNAWYFWNTSTGEVTWTNPLDPSASSTEVAPPLPPGPPPAAAAPAPAQRRFGAIPEIDPDLAYLLPANQRGGPSDPASAGQSAMFNARTGRFTNNDYQYTVEHLDEYNREKRFNNRYFDQDKWERERMLENAKRKRDEEMGVDTTKKVTKKDMERFKKKKIEKRLRSQAWLRD